MNKKIKEGCECKDKKKESKTDSSIEEIEARRERVESIQNLLADIHYKTEEDKDQAILSFTKCALSIPEIEKLVIPLKPGYLSSKDAQLYKRGLY